MQTSRALFGTQGSSSTAEFFKPSRAQGARLRHYGIDCRIPCVQVVLCLNYDAATIMHNQLLTLRPGRKAKSGSAIPTSFRLPLNCPWEPPEHSFLAAALAEKVERRLQNETACSEGTGHLSPPPSSFMLQCPRATCKKLREAARSTLVKGVAWTQLKCPCCMRSSSAAKWLCPCGIPWHSCKDNRGPSFACGAKPRFKKKTNPVAHADPLLHSAHSPPPVYCQGQLFASALRDISMQPN